MEKHSTAEILSNLLLGKFLIHFVPGILLYFGILRLIHSHIDYGFFALIITISFSWTLGLLLEMVFFQENYQHRINSEPKTNEHIHRTLVAKVGMAILFVVGVIIFDGILEILSMNKDLHLRLAIILGIKTVVFGGFGLFLYLMFRKTSVN